VVNHAGIPLDIHPHQLMHKVWPVAEEVYPNEMGLFVMERNEQAPDHRGFRRYQTIFVVRKDALAKYMEDMGLSDFYVAPELLVPGADLSKPRGGEWYHTVSELKDYADDFRGYLLERQYHREMPDLISGYHDHMDEVVRDAKHVSQFGPQFAVQRA
jgi:hypothetical protein